MAEGDHQVDIQGGNNYEVTKARGERSTGI